MIEESLNIPITVVLRILKEDLEKRKLCARLFRNPWHLSKGKIESHLAKTDPETMRQSSEWVGETPPCPKRLKFQRSRIKNHVDNFFDSRGVVHKEFVQEGKTVNAECCKGVMDRLLKRIQRVRPAAFCCRDHFLLHDNAPPPHKAASVCRFLTLKNVTTLYHPRTLQIYLRQTVFCSKVENENKMAPLCGCC